MSKKIHPIHAWLIDTGHTQMYLAKETGIAGSYISYIIRTNANVTLSVATKIVRATGGAVTYEMLAKANEHTHTDIK